MASSALLAQSPAARVGRFQQEVAKHWTAAEGLPSADVLSLAATSEGVWAGTAQGLARFAAGEWHPLRALAGRPVTALLAHDDTLWAAARGVLYRIESARQPPVEILHFDPTMRVASLALAGRQGTELLLATAGGLFESRGARLRRVALSSQLDGDTRVYDLARELSGCPTAVAAAAGLFLRRCESELWERLFPRAGHRSWAPTGVRAVAFDRRGHLWFGSPQGVGRLDFETSTWRLFDERDGLPFLDLSAVATGGDGQTWFGTSIGAIRFSSENWEYRQGRRWLPGDAVRDLLVDDEGQAWIATDGGVGRIGHRPLTLAEKARIFEQQIDRYHRRTPFEFIAPVVLERPGDTDSGRKRDTDNDGLWTGMYGAGECFAYAATGSLLAKQRARKAFESLRFLSEVTQGGSHPTDPGFIARTILPTSGPDPNVGRAARDRRKRAEDDSSWKLIEPRWPTSADGRWYWKTDASSDELDGHFFFYALYYDLVAEGEAERREVREVILRIVDHLITHDFALVDHDGQPTRWAVFGPLALNQGPDWWGERGLNSLSILSYLRLAAHVSQDRHYDEVARQLIDEHDYAANTQVPKVHTGPGTGNQSDDEMAFMSFYNLLKYERDPQLRSLWAHAFFRYWQMEGPERNPLFNFLYAASYDATVVYKDAFGPVPLAPTDGWLEDSVDTLLRYPLDRIDWGLRNRHRQDLVFLDSERSRGRRRDGKVLPIDERFVEHWNHDPWRLDYEGEGRKLADGASFLLPYYMGLYQRFLVE